MSKSVDQLILALNKEYEIYKDYYTLAKNKNEILIEGNVKELERITKKEQDVIAVMGKIDQIRTAIIGNILFEKKIDWVESLTELASHIEASKRAEIIALKDKLRILLEEIKNLNDLNGKLIRQSLDYIEFNVNLLTNVELKGNTYGSRADEQDLKHRPNLFDAKV
ncbi:flagellar protein FlgN [Crassaminicella thermophila]|nr:flagellar protein FlgN [Crassaminicella thermophila]